MSAPPIPPLPPGPITEPPPPLPPLPPQLQESAPHFDNPLVAPRPHRLDPDLPANMARTLDDQSYGFGAGPGGLYPRGPQSYNSTYNPNPGFAAPGQFPTQSYGRTPSPLPPPEGSAWGTTTPQPQPRFSQAPPAQPYRAPAGDTLSSSLASLSFSSPPPPPQPPHPGNQTRAYSTYGPLPNPSPKPPSPMKPGQLTAPLPTISSLSAALPSIQSSPDPQKIAWARDVTFLVDRLMVAGSGSTEVPQGPARILDPQLTRCTQVAIPLILQISGVQVQSGFVPPLHIAEAIYLRATFEASGAYPDYVKQNPRSAFRDFELAARSGFSQAWFRLGRDYENFNDFPHAKDCFERGVKLGVESCCYRMGMANLMGQLGLPVDVNKAVPLLHRAATLSSIDVPQPAYVYALLLLSEFTHVSVPAHAFAPYIPPDSSLSLEARKHLERAAFLNFAPAQYKLGHAYEFAQPPFLFDPLLSVQYYSLASQQGEIEADMALSKWFLCGAEGAFDKDEGLAYTFAEKAARRGLPSAEFAMGYYAEVGVGGPNNVENARKWYQRAADHGNSDAIDRLQALSQPAAQVLSRQEHDTITESKLVRKRTQAKQRSEANATARPPPHRQVMNLNQVVDVARRASLDHGPNYHLPSRASPPAGLTGVPEGSPNTSPRQRPIQPRQQSQQQYPNQHRYTLSDAGPFAGPPPPNAPPLQGGPIPPGGGRPAGRPPAQRLQSGPQRQQNGPGGPPAAPAPAPEVGMGGTVVFPAKPSRGPATFAEMGFQGAKAEDKECVIM